MEPMTMKATTVRIMKKDWRSPGDTPFMKPKAAPGFSA
jgi:hypothetical protein